MNTTTILGACPHDCPDTCSLVTTVQDGVATKVQGNPDHPMTDGVLCAKVSRYTERTYHPDRLLYPMKRTGPKGSGQFARIGWDEALDTIASRLAPLIATRPEKLLPYSYAGTMGLIQGESIAMRFFNVVGAAKLDRTICSSAGGEALTQTLGGKVGMKMGMFAESKLIIIWGSNSITSNIHFWRIAQEAKRHGARLVCIDPRRSETADKCDLHLAIKPGTDAALALALMHELITHGWLDHDYIAQYTLGFDDLRERAMQWPPERAAQVCGLDVHDIRQLAHDYAHTRPAGIRLNYGVQRSRGGGNAVRAIACLPALTGAWRHPGGGVLMSATHHARANNIGLQRPDLHTNTKAPLINMSTIGDALHTPGLVEAMIVYNSNPVAVAPESAKVVSGFAREDLFTVVLEHFMTDTADYADLVLPATTQLEHWDIHNSYGHTDVVLNQPAIAPVGEAKTNTQIFRELSVRLGLDHPLLQESDEALLHTALQSPSNLNSAAPVTWDALKQHGFAHWPVADAPFAQGGFPTPSGKCEFFSERLAAMGQDPVPDYLPNHEQADSQATYPLAMISPPARNFLNSTFVNVKSLRDMEGEPLLEIHPQDAQARQVNDGDMVRVFNARGSYHCKAQVTTRAQPGMVVGLGVWWRKLGPNHTNVNELTSQLLTDMGRAPVFYDCTVQVASLR
ncbi:MAG: molybdopterin oxidoreductase family protein [Betaproteobacteria bacterium]|nr:molybdopterin oxidoreductase family protein [Betaproteobacteria bacterium]